MAHETDPIRRVLRRHGIADPAAFLLSKGVDAPMKKASTVIASRGEIHMMKGHPAGRTSIRAWPPWNSFESNFLLPEALRTPPDAHAYPVRIPETERAWGGLANLDITDLTA